MKKTTKKSPKASHKKTVKDLDVKHAKTVRGGVSEIIITKRIDR